MRLVLRRLGAKAAENWLTDILVSAKVVNPSVEDYIGGAVKLATFADQSITLFDTCRLLVEQVGHEKDDSQQRV